MSKTRGGAHAPGYFNEYYKRTRPSRLAYQRAWRAKRKALGCGKAVSHRKTRYGVTAEQYADMVAAQHGQCAICQMIPAETLRVDHDHVTGEVRALLCRKCNTAIGFLGDSVAMLTKALMYLRFHNAKGRRRA